MVSVAEFHIGLQYISMQHTGYENEFLLKIFDRWGAKTRIFSYVKVGGGAKWSSCPPQDLAQMAPLTLVPKIGCSEGHLF